MSSRKDDYVCLHPEEDFSAINEQPSERQLRQWRRPRTSTIVLSTTTILFGLLSLYLSLQTQVVCLAQTGRQHGYPTEWGLVAENIELEQVVFKSAFRYNETSKTFYREFDPAEPQYVGDPGPEIDHAWEELLAGQYLIIDETEAQELEDPVPIEGIYIAEVEVMHSLHCLNAIRMALHREYYSAHGKHKLPENVNQVHVEHCLDQLRQSIQCSGDLTSVPLRPYGEPPNINLIGTPQTHTWCVSFFFSSAIFPPRAKSITIGLRMPFLV